MCLWTGNAPVFCADREEDAAETTRLNFLIAITVETVCIKAEELGGRADRAICCLQWQPGKLIQTAWLVTDVLGITESLWTNEEEVSGWRFKFFIFKVPGCLKKFDHLVKLLSCSKEYGFSIIQFLAHGSAASVCQKCSTVGSLCSFGWSLLLENKTQCLIK